MFVTNDLLGLGQDVDVAIIGASDLVPTLDTGDRTSFDLITEVAAQTINEAGIDLDTIDGLVTSSILEAPFMAASVLAEYLMLRPNFLQHVDLGGCTGAASVIRAASAIQAGLCNTVLVVTAATKGVLRAGAPLGPSTVPPGYKEATPQGIFDVPTGATGGVFAYGMLAAHTASECGLRPEHTYAVLRRARERARANERALHHRDSVPSLDDYLASAVTAEPLRRLDAATSSGGASALIVTAYPLARAARQRPVIIRGMGESHTHRSITNMPSLARSGGADAAARAFAQAKTPARSVDITMIYDAFTYLVPRGLCEAGIAEPGEIAGILGDDAASAGINPNGGQLGCGHTGVAAGMSLVTGAVRQLSGTAGSVQIARAERAFVSATGGEMSTNAALVLEAGQ